LNDSNPEQLQNVPAFGEQAIGYADDVGGDLILRLSSVHKSAVDDHVTTFGIRKSVVDYPNGVGMQPRRLGYA
jgi:hypothetical protein